MVQIRTDQHQFVVFSKVKSVGLKYNKNTYNNNTYRNISFNNLV